MLEFLVCLNVTYSSRVFDALSGTEKLIRVFTFSENQHCNITSLTSELCGDNIDVIGNLVLPLPAQHPIRHAVSNNNDEIIGLRSIAQAGGASSHNSRNDGQPNRAKTPGTRRRCENMRENKVPKIRDVDHEVAELFVKYVLPSISSEFSETLRAIPNKERQAILLQQLRSSMIDTTRLVLKNHRMDHCLPTASVNSLTHSYPLVLREIESWHDMAIKKMVPDNRWACWRPSSSSNCMSRLSFSLPLAPTLWAPLTKLIKDFGGKCDPILSSDQSSDSSECSILPGAIPCRDDRASNSSLCQPKKCRFSEYAVDVRAFFRHVNDSRNFLLSGSGQEPFEKPINKKTRAGDSPLRGKLKLVVNNLQPFQIYYVPTSEKVKITFHYVQTPDRPSTRLSPVPTPQVRPIPRTSTVPSTTNAAFHCVPKVEKKLTEWFEDMMSSLKTKSKNCQRQKDRANSEVSGRAGHHALKKRSSVANNFPTVARCLYERRSFRNFPDSIWNSLVQRAIYNGGRYFEEQHSVVFFNKNQAVQFFNQRCTETPTAWTAAFRNMRKAVPKRRKTVDVEIFVSDDLPFRIEKPKPGRIQLKYFTVLVR